MKIMKILLLTIGACIPSGVVGVTKQLTRGFLASPGVELKIVSHWVGRSPYEIWEPPTMYYESSTKGLAGQIDIYNYENFEHVLNFVRAYLPDIIHVHSYTWADYIQGGISRIKEAAGNPPIIYTIHTPKSVRYNPISETARNARIRRRANELMEEIQTTIRAYKKSGMAVDQAYYNFNYDAALWSAGVEGPAVEELFSIADKIIVVVDSHEDSLKKNYPEIAHKFVTIHNVPNIDRNKIINEVSDREIAGAKYEMAPNSEKLIVYIGRAEKLKGLKLIGSAFNILMEKNRVNNYKIVGIGGLGTGEVDRDNFIEWTGIDNKYASRIQFFGWRDLKTYYRMMELSNRVNAVLIMPIGPRGLLTAMEGALMRIPVVSWGLDTKITFSTHPSPRNLAEMIEYIYNPANFSQVQRIVNKASEIVQKEYTLDLYIKKHLEVYRAVIDDKRLIKTGKYEQDKKNNMVNVRSKDPEKEDDAELDIDNEILAALNGINEGEVVDKEILEILSEM